MILANITRAIRQQNWFAVVVEFLIVIAGVVIGFQITAWMLLGIAGNLVFFISGFSGWWLMRAYGTRFETCPME